MTILVALLLGVGVAIQLLCVLGLLAMDNVFDRLHYLAPALLGSLAFTIAIGVREGTGQLTIKAALVFVLLAISGPILAHATARAARVRQFEGWSILNTERAEAAEPLAHDSMLPSGKRS